MPTVEERLTALEARVNAVSDTSQRCSELRSDMNLRFAQVNGRFSELRDDFNLRLGEINARFDVLHNDVNHRLEEISRRFADLDGKSDRQLAWLIGTQVAVLLAVVAALVGAFSR
jgi:tetrahydromethanopterin S-methyltransferase subunit G